MDISIQESFHQSDIKVSIVGVGGGGNNAINHLSVHGVHSSIKLVAVNTDAQHLRNVSAHVKLQIGEKTTRGYGAGMLPEKGRKSAEESYEAIKDSIRDSNIVFVTTGLGGGTGTGASPVVAKAAKEIGALVIGVVTKPFRVEGKQREKLAEEGVKEIKDEVDAIIVIPNEKLLSIVSKSLGMKDSLKLVDNVLAQAVNGISSFVLNPSNEGANVDYADLMTTMEFKGLALIGVGNKQGEDAAIEAVKEAISSPLLDNLSIKGARGAITYFEINENFPVASLMDAAEIIDQSIDSSATNKIGWSYNNNLSIDEVRVTLVVTGFEKEMLQKDDMQCENSVKITKTKRTTAIRKVSGEYNDLIIDGQDLDSPTFLRNQMD